MEEVTLRDVGGIGHLHGIDQNSRQWVEFWTDNVTTRNGAMECNICGSHITEIATGWMCLDNGEIRCFDHVRY
ncbi:hypothetical protein ACFL2Q_03110 [Thermodesulfobacteriota bacterium]